MGAVKDDVLNLVYNLGRLCEQDRILLGHLVLCQEQHHGVGKQARCTPWLILMQAVSDISILYRFFACRLSQALPPSSEHALFTLTCPGVVKVHPSVASATSSILPI